MLETTLNARHYFIYLSQFHTFLLICLHYYTYNVLCRLILLNNKMLYFCVFQADYKYEVRFKKLIICICILSYRDKLVSLNKCKSERERERGIHNTKVFFRLFITDVIRFKKIRMVNLLGCWKNHDAFLQLMTLVHFWKYQSHSHLCYCNVI